jgi:DNA-directed RNA polymerase subunit beta'
VQEGDFVEKGDYMIDGNPAPHDILRSRASRRWRLPRQRNPGSLPAAGREDQRQAHRGDRSPDAAEGRDHRRGDTTCSRASRSTKIEFDEDQRQGQVAEGKKPAGQAGAAGHHQGSLQTRSFISAASFQETTRVLTEAAVNGKSTRWTA